MSKYVYEVKPSGLLRWEVLRETLKTVYVRGPSGPYRRDKEQLFQSEKMALRFAIEQGESRINQAIQHLSEDVKRLESYRSRLDELEQPSGA